MWPLPLRLAFRFAFVFVGLLAVHALVLALWVEKPFVPYWRAWSALVSVLARLLGIHELGDIEGSDAAAAWLQLLLSAAFAVVIAAIWSAVTKRREHARLADHLRTLVRYSLASAMLSYGLDKVFAVQFFFPSPADLVQTFGGSSPFALVWRFMGYSTPYAVFGGVIETAGAIFLLWRRTTMLGALITATAMVNVVMLNLAYDIPVKCFSMQLLALDLYLLIPDGRDLFALFVLGRPMTPAPPRPFPLTPRIERVRPWSKALFIAAILAINGFDLARRAPRGDASPHPELWGSYEVEEQRKDGAVVPLLINDPNVWHQLAFGRNWSPSMVLITADGERHSFALEHDAKSGLIRLDQGKLTFTVHKLDGQRLELEGNWGGGHLVVRFRPHDLSHAQLLTRRPHFIENSGGFWE
jgi:hypothetical protein